ncbi:LeuA family protein [Desulfonatronum parangueonense]
MLIDSTLREGAQMFGVYFTDELRRRILTELVRARIEEVEIGWVGQEGLPELLRHGRLVDPEGRTSLTVWSPLRSRDLRALAEQGVRRVHFGVPVSDAHIEKRLHLDRAGLLERLRRVLEDAASLQFDFLSIGLEDISRADREFALEAAKLVRECGGHRVRLSDTVGVLTPLETAELVRLFVEQAGLMVGFHGHNDFGMATANAITALAAGAHCVDVSALGIGERAGIAALEEVSAHLNVRKMVGYDQAGILNLARMVGEAACIPVARNKVLLGQDLFACESGLHLHGLAADPALFEPFAPEGIGAHRKTAVGMKSGTAAVAEAIRGLGIILPRRDIEDLGKHVRELSGQLARPLRDDELLLLASSRHEHQDDQFTITIN